MNGGGRGWGLTILRIVVGVVFLMHGWQKLYTMGPNRVAGAFKQMGIPQPRASALVVTAVEFVGGLLLILGLFTHYAALLLAINMLVAVLLVHLKNGFFLPGGYEFALTLLAASLALVLSGPGEAALARRRGKLR